MKTIKVLSTLFALMLLPLAVNATPQLQLDCDPCEYDPVTEDNVAESAVFDVAAIVTPGNNTNGDNVDVANDQFWMSIALAGLTDESGDAAAAQAIFDNLLISPDGGTTWGTAAYWNGLIPGAFSLVFGTPPSADTENPELAGHGYYDTWYIEINLTAIFGVASGWDDCETYNVVNEGWAGDSLGSGDSYCAILSFDRGDIESTAVLHYDLFTTDGEGQFKKAAPFSHDVTSVPEPGTLSLLGLGLLALGLGRRRREIA